MRILFVCPNMEAGGAERQWASVIEGLAGRGHDVQLLTLDGTGAFFDRLKGAGISCNYLAFRRRLDLRALGRAYRAAARFRPDVMVTRGVSAQVVVAPLAAVLRVPVVTTMHGGAHLPVGRHRRWLVRLTGARSTAAVAVAADQLPSLAAAGFRADRLNVIPNGVSERALRPSRPRSDVRAKLGLDDGRFFALLVANLREEKRVDVFIRAIAAAAAVEPRIAGVVVGDGALRKSLAALADAIGGPVQMVGYRDDVADLLSAADVVCLTSDVEALPMCVLEAMAAGRAVVATRVGDVTEAVVDGETGILVEPGDVAAFALALEQLAADPTRVAAMGFAARERQQRLFAHEAMLDAYETLLASPGRATAVGARCESAANLARDAE